MCSAAGAAVDSGAAKRRVGGHQGAERAAARTGARRESFGRRAAGAAGADARAYKLSKRAARVGFDFEHAGQTADKVAEELAEVREAAAGRDT